MSVSLGTPISSLMTNRRRVGALKSLGMVTVGDALTYYPFRVTDPVPLRAIREARVGESMAFAGRIRSSHVATMNARRGFRIEVVVDDSEFAASRNLPGAVARLVFFSYKKQYVSWMSGRLQQGVTVVVCGQPSVYNDQLQFTHPEILTVGGFEGADSGNYPDSGSGGYARGHRGDQGRPSDVSGRRNDVDSFSGRGNAGRSGGGVASPSRSRGDVETVEEGLRRVCRPRPVYHASSRISSDHIRDSILGFLRLLAEETGDKSGENDDNADAAVDVSVHNNGDVTSAKGTPSSAGRAVHADAAHLGDAGVAVGGGYASLDAAASGVMAGDAHARAEGAAAGGSTGVNAIKNSAVNGDTAGADVGNDAMPSWRQLVHAIPDILPESVRAERQLMHRAEAFLAVHNPPDRQSFNRAIGTLRYEEAFVCQTSLLQSRRNTAQSAAEPCADLGLRDRFIAGLPFALTDGQRAVIDDIAADMAAPRPMQRLLQGEVGSGKTVVAVAAMLQAVGSGRQAVLVAPTQVLAEQHYQTIRGMMDRLGESPTTPPVVLLTGGMKLAARRRALATVASGEPCIVVATHAAFSKTFQAPNLALAIIDEQHRFGVEQRESLRGKSASGATPHLLVMTATPIPRTAAMTWFGDLDISWLTELPGGRKPIRTVVVPEADGRTMASMFAHIRRRIDAGERAYVVCARIDESDETTEGELTDDSAMLANGGFGTGSVGGMSVGSGGGNNAVATAAADMPADGSTVAGSETSLPPLHSVHQIADRLSKLPQFQGIDIATLTGRDDDATKQQVMESFASGRTPIVVATTVIEVGVDVPQASCIVVFDADRFGLSQLHQLRGRVGRGGTQSWAFLVSRAEPGSLGERRLDVIRDTTDGAQIAQADLELRGAGDVLGDAQSGGRSSLKLLRVVQDADLIADARSRAQELLDADPQLEGEVELAGAVLDFTRGNETFLTST